MFVLKTFKQPVNETAVQPNHKFVKYPLPFNLTLSLFTALHLGETILEYTYNIPCIGNRL